MKWEYNQFEYGGSMNIGNELLIDIKHLLGNQWSVKRENLDTYSKQIRRAAGDISKLRQSGKGPDGSQVLFPHLPYLLKEEVLISREEREALLRLREEAKGYDAVISIGIGGSYLGNQVLLISSAAHTGTSSLKMSGKDIPRFIFPARM